MSIAPKSSTNFVLREEQPANNSTQQSSEQQTSLLDRFKKQVNRFTQRVIYTARLSPKVSKNHVLLNLPEKSKQIVSVEDLQEQFSFDRSMQDYTLLIQNQKQKKAEKKAELVNNQALHTEPKGKEKLLTSYTKLPNFDTKGKDIPEIVNIEEVEVQEIDLWKLEDRLKKTIKESLESNLKDLQNSFARTNTKTFQLEKTHVRDDESSILLNKIVTKLDNIKAVKASFWKKAFVGVLSTFVLSSVILNIYLIANNSSFVDNLASEITDTQNLVDTKVRPGTRVIDNFSNEKSIVDVGAKLKITPSQISTEKSPNCQTSDIVSEKNGCNFTIALNLSGIPKEGVYYTSMQIFGKMGPESQILTDLKSFETGNSIKRISTIDQTSLKKKISIPNSFLGSQGLYINLWDKDKQGIVIDEIRFNYFYIENLSEVLGKIKNVNVTQEAVVYWDKNENSRLDLQIDPLWTCSSEFPGVEPVNISANGEFELVRADNCYEQVDVTTILNDENQRALPAGQWLLRLNDGTVIPFEIPVGEKKVVLDLAKT